VKKGSTWRVGYVQGKEIKLVNIEGNWLILHTDIFMEIFKESE
jgi:hypothetical protein